MKNLTHTIDQIRTRLEAIDQVREMAYKQSRDVIRLCASAIRAVHRTEWETAEELIAEAETAVAKLTAATQPFPQIYHAGYTQDCIKEYVEAELTYALVRNRPLKTPTELRVDDAAWINGLAEAATELRRHLLDLLRDDHDEETDRLLDDMDNIYTALVTLDFHDAISGGLRRRLDTVRAVLERTRGDVTTSLRQAKLERALAKYK
jgi:translin